MKLRILQAGKAMAEGLWNEFMGEDSCSVFLPGLQVLDFSKEKLSHKGLKQFKEEFLCRLYISAMESLDAEYCNHWKFPSIQKKMEKNP